eukprot:CAMPEP_0119432000 /NCGR_PEP_ID=MMETSP1335-20130426/46999_1 /TAXON_ID=259385 /ORGANISM="Chrysoculter rhomboideus, Strain RCC1486" /LENGTH=49 /DNA_ID= /DNA_START= /DNA_END= /DNA_ORIENTATION=
MTRWRRQRMVLVYRLGQHCVLDANIGRLQERRAQVEVATTAAHSGVPAS